MTDLEQQKPGGKSDRRKDKKKRNKKVEQQASPPTEQAEAASEAVYAAMEEPASPAAAVEAAPAEPVERVASFRERMASVMPPAETAPAKPAVPADVAQPAPSPATPVPATPVPAASPATGMQAIANAYRDYTRQSLEDAQTFAEKLSAARSLDKAVEAQTEFARQACETFADNSRKIRELHRELFWQTFRLPGWPLGRTR